MRRLNDEESQSRLVTYFSTWDTAAIAIFSALWGVSNAILSPIVFQMLGLPILCDVIGFATLTLGTWWIGKLGAASAVGLIATAINFLFNPGGVHFLGFTVASIVFDATSKLIGHERVFRNKSSVTASMLPISVISAALAGLFIGTLFMAAPALDRWGGVVGSAGLQAVGGIIGGAIGVALVVGLTARGMGPQT